MFFAEHICDQLLFAEACYVHDGYGTQYMSVCIESREFVLIKKGIP